MESLRKEMSQLIGKCKDDKLCDLIMDEVTDKEAEESLTPQDYERWIQQLSK
jgi:hypothetical protein